MTRDPDSADEFGENRRELLNAVGDDAEEADTGRRSVLRGAAATALATVGLTSTAAAVDPTGKVALDLVQRKYASAEAKRRALRRDGREVLELLAERGHLDRASLDAMDADEFDVGGRRLDGTATAHVRATESTDDGEIILAVEPEAGRSYAVVESGDDTVILDPSADGDEVDPSGCIIGSACFATSTSCDSDCAKLEVYCCTDGSCYTGSSTGCCSGTCYSSCSYACN